MIAWFFRLACCLLVAGVLASPASALDHATASAFAIAGSDDEVLSQSILLHTADHNVTSLGVLFSYAYIEPWSLTQYTYTDPVVFFIESEINEQGERVDYGLYGLTRERYTKQIVSTKLLDSARDIAVASLTKEVYFATKDGIYIYNEKKNSAEKYGSISDDVVSIAVENATGVLYYMNKQHKLYKVTEGGQKSIFIDAVKNAEQFTLDNKSHLYYYTTDKKFYVYDGQSVRPVEGIPKNLKKVWFVKTPLFVEDYCLVNGDEENYQIWGNATAVAMGSSRRSLAASALPVDNGVVAYFTYNRKIYMLNVTVKIVKHVLSEISKVFRDLRKSSSGDPN